MAWYRRRRWRPWRRRRRPWTLRRRRARRFVRRRPRRRYVSRWRRRRYRRRLRRGRRRRGRRRRKETIIVRQWQPDVIKNCYITGFLPLIVCGSGNTQFNFITHENDIPPRGASYGGNLTNITFTLAALYDQYLLHRNRWSRSNFDLDLARYINTKLKLYRHDTVDYIVTYNRTGPFEVNPLTYMHTHPLLMLMNKHHIVVPSLKTKPKGRRYIKVKIKPPKLMLNKWYFAKDICPLGLFQLYATGLELRNPWVREGTNSPIVGFYVLKPSLYNGNMSNLADTEHLGQRTALFNKLYPSSNTKDEWQYTYNKPMQKIYYEAANKSDSGFKNQTYNWTNYKTNYSKVHTQWQSVAKQNYTQVYNEFKEVYPLTATWPPQWANRQYMSHDFGIYSPYFLSPGRFTDYWHSAYTYVRYNPMSDKGIGNIICIQWCSEKFSEFNETKNKCILRDMPLYMLTYGYLDYTTKCTGSNSIWTDARVAIRCPYTDPPLSNPTNKNTLYIPLSTSFMQGDMPWPTTNIPLKMWFKWYPMIMHQKACLETIVSCGPFMPRDQTASSWDITIAYRAFFKWGGNPLPPQPIDDPCQKDTHEIPDPDKHPRGIQISDPKVLGPPTVFHTWDIRRGLFSSTSLKRVSEYQPPDDPFSTGVVFKRPRLETQYKGTQETPEEDAYNLLKALQKEQETSSSEEDIHQEEQEIQKTQLLKQLQLQQQQQRILKRGIRHLFGDVLRLRKGVHFNPDLL
nr:MAG: ORF1 [Torque teno virus]